MPQHLHKKQPKHPSPTLPDDTPKDPEENPTAPTTDILHGTPIAVGLPHPQYGVPMTRGMVKRYKREHGDV